MYVFLDESGDTGFKFHANSSRFFVVTLLIVAFKHAAGMRPVDELKFRTARPRTREQFFTTICLADFHVRATIVDKTRLAHAPAVTSQAFYQEQIRDILVRASATVSNARLIIDQSVKSRTWQQDTSAFLRQQVNSGSERIIRDIRFRTSNRDPLLQATDMICGAFMDHAVSGERRFIDLLNPRIEDLFRIP